MRHSPRISYQEPSLPAVSSGALLEHKLNGDTAVAAGSVTVDRAPALSTRQGKVAIGVGLSTCEIREVTAIAGAALTLSSNLYYSHTANERVVFFELGVVPMSWWGITGNDSSIDSRIAWQRCLRAVSKAGNSPLAVEMQSKDIWCSGPWTVPNGVTIQSSGTPGRVRCIASGAAAYTGPMDGPDNATYETNAFAMASQVTFPFTADAASDTITVTDAAGNPVAAGSYGGFLTFDSDGTTPGGLIPGRVYRGLDAPLATTYAATAADNALTTPVAHKAVVGNSVVIANPTGGAPLAAGTYFVKQVLSPTAFTVAATSGGAVIDITSDGTGDLTLTRTSTFKLALKAGGSALDITADGSGWLHLQIGDNVKVYTRNLWLDGVNVGRKSVTADSSTDTLTSTSHGFVEGQEIKLRATGTLPGGLSKNTPYYVRNPTANTFQLAATVAGTPIDLTSNGGTFHAVPTQAALNGCMFGMQQPSKNESLRVDSFIGYGAKTWNQQSYWTNVEIIDCGVNLDLGHETAAGGVAEFIWIYGFDSEQANEAVCKIRDAKNVSFVGGHIEISGPDKTNLVFDIAGQCDFVYFDNFWISAGQAGTTLFKIHRGNVNISKASFHIRGLQGTFNATVGGTIVIHDQDKGIYTDMVDWAQRIDEYHSFAPDNVTDVNPHPKRWDGLRGAYVFDGSTGSAVASYRRRKGFRDTGDTFQLQTWTKQAGTVTLNPATDVFTCSVAHGLVEGQEIGIYNASVTGSDFVAEAGSPAYVNDTVYRAKNVTATTFQIAHTPPDPVLNFADVLVAGSAAWKGQFQLFYPTNGPGALARRVDKQGFTIERLMGAQPADADLQPGEGTRWWDTDGVPVFKSKKLDGTVVSTKPSTGGGGGGAGGPTIAALAADVGPVVSSTTLQDITGLGVAIGASATEIWLLKYWLLVEAANSTMDSRFGFVLPAGATNRWGPIVGANATPGWGGPASGTVPGVLNTASAQIIGTAAGISGAPLVAIVFGGGTAGTAQIQFAQGTSDAGNLTIKKGSVVEATKIVA